ncbi:MAG: hypothetical protein LBL01_06340 [Bifidobacteriaceae bacterium]|nr:hypothetical protein [Bifidobacteriaceae bacterium]
MPNYILNSEAAAQIPAGTLVVSFEATGQAVGCRLAVTSAGRDVPGVQRPSGRMVVIPPQAQAFAVEAQAPDSAAGFGADVSVSLHVEQQADSVNVDVPPVDVSGVPRRVLLDVAIAPGGYALRAPAPEVRLATPAAEARALAREALGGIDRLPEDQAATFTVAVDASASMRRLAASGSLEAAARVLTGLAMVLTPARGPRLRYALVGQTTQFFEFDPAAPDAAVKQLTARLSGSAPLIGVDLAPPELAGRGAGPRNAVYYLTDGVPGELARIAAQGALPGEIRHLVILAPGAQIVEPSPVGITQLELPPGGDLTASLLAGDRLRQAVWSLLGGFLGEPR